MANKKKDFAEDQMTGSEVDSPDLIQAEDQMTGSEVDSPELIQAKIDSLVDEVLTLRELADLLKEENAGLKAEIAALSETTARVANSASIAPEPTPPPVRPVVEIGGERYQFKVGEVRLSARQVVRATDIAADENLLGEVFGKYPGLFQKL